jgi:hypothetical protein
MLKGFTIDAARLPEPLPLYRRMVDLMAGWGCDTLLLRLTDDQGSAYRFASHPELITHRHAFGADELRELAGHARSRGIEVIPEIESFGHARYITDVPRHAHLFDGERPADGRFVYNSLSPVAPGSHALIADLYAEIAAIVPGRYLHGGCDEVNWGHGEASKLAIAEHGREAIWIGYINRLAATARALGRELIIWADHVLRHDAEFAEGLDPTIILHEWDYWTIDAAELRARAERGIARGHRVIGGPGTIYAQWGPRAGAPQFANLQAYCATYRTLDPAFSLGVIATDWLPSRTVPWANLDLYSIAGACLSGEDLTTQAGRDRAFGRFVEGHLGAAWDARWREAFAELYRLGPARHPGGPLAAQPRLLSPWRNAEEARAQIAAGAPEDPGYAALADRIAELSPEVRRHRTDYDALVLTVDYLAHLWWRAAAIARPAPDLAVIARADASMRDRLERQWVTARHADDLGDDPRLAVEMPDPRDHLHRSMRAAAAFSAALAADRSLLGAPARTLAAKS